MTFTWNTATLGTSALQQVRLTIGDKDSSRPLLTDEEITYRLSEYSSDVLQTAIACVTDILAKLARDIDRSNVGMSATRSQQTTHYQDLLADLQGRSSVLCTPYVGGTSEDEADTLETDTDWRQVGTGLDWGKNNG